MPIRQTKPHILTELRLDLFFYRILLLSPFEILPIQQLSSTWRIKLYVCTVLIVFASLRIYFVMCLAESAEIFDLFLFNGQLWMLCDLFDFAFVSLSFCGIVINALVTTNHQIKFYENLNDFNVKLIADFGISIQRSRTQTVNRWVLMASLAYFSGDFIYFWMHFKNTILTNYQNFALLFPFYLTNILTFATALQYVDCTQLLRERLQVIRKILGNYRTFRCERLDKVLLLYTRITNQTCLINRFMGFVVLLKLTHDFTLGTSVVYIMCSKMIGFKYFFYLMWWFSITIIGTLLMTLVAHKLMAEVYKIVKMRIFLIKIILKIFLLR